MSRGSDFLFLGCDLLRYAFLRTPSDFVTTLRIVISGGGDTDSTGARHVVPSTLYWPASFIQCKQLCKILPVDSSVLFNDVLLLRI